MTDSNERADSNGRADSSDGTDQATAADEISDEVTATAELPDDSPVIVLHADVRDAIVDRARAGAPEEVCGIFGGEFGRERSRVVSWYPAENLAERPRTRYRIDPEQQLAVFERLEDRGEEIVGFFHSHPRGPSGPSATDVARATWPDRSYLIVSLAPTLEVGSWRWREGDEAGTGMATENGTAGRFERERIDLESG